MRLWLVTELFYPEESATSYILTHIANALADQFDLHVICGPAKYGGYQLDGDKQVLHLRPEVHLHRIDADNYDKDNILARVKNQIMISFKLFKSLKNHLQKEDRILLVTNPPLCLVLVSRLAKKRKNPFYLIVNDVFPENTIPAGLVKSEKSFLYRLLKGVFDRAYKRADKLIACGRDMKYVLEEKVKLPHNTELSDKRVVVIENWAELDLVRPVVGEEHSGLVIQFAGNVGRVQGLSHFLDLFHQVGNPHLHFSIWGEGSAKRSLENMVQTEGIQRVAFHPIYLRADQSAVLSEADLALVTLAEGMYGLGVPSKSYNIMAAGKPILFIGDLRSEIAMMVQDHQIGFCFDASDDQGIKSFLSGLDETKMDGLKAMGIKARSLAETLYSEEAIMNKYLKEIE